MSEQRKPDIFDKLMTLPVLRIFGPFYAKHKMVLLYLLFGGCTTVISIGSFMAFVALGIDALVANVLSWVLAVTFAYATNRTWVFDSRARGWDGIAKEAAAFFGGRLLTLGIEEVLLLVFITWLGLNSSLVKIAAQIVVLVLNFIISKLMVFRQKKQ